MRSKSEEQLIPYNMALNHPVRSSVPSAARRRPVRQISTDAARMPRKLSSLCHKENPG